ncbi:MAG: carbon-nitrogen family hydrolase [Planctomycetes bacterium]|nr:carbon-nitrogen family hydrolase [Planctomycetota bacterium]
MVTSTTPPDEYRAACVQFDVRPGDVATNVAAMRTGVEEAVAGGAQLCVLPELWPTSFVANPDEALLHASAAAEEDLRELTASHGLVAIGSALEAADGKFFNTAVVFERGEVRAKYRKIHLFSPNLEHRLHAWGHDPCIAETSLGRIGILICYDLRFPELARYYFRKGAELLAVPGQWPEARALHWRTLLRARAIENEMFVIGCNRTGQEPSQRNGEAMAFPGDGRIVDPTGEVLASGSGEAGAVIATIELRNVRTMRRILPLHRDQRPSVYRRLFDETYSLMVTASREGKDPADSPDE